MERLTMFDFIENLALPQRVERIQTSIQAQAEKFKKQQSRLKNTGLNTRDRMVEEWRRRVPTPEEQLEKYRKRMRTSVDRLALQWNEHTAVTAREKASFIAGVMNIFISGYLIGGHPDFFPVWYTVQLLYFMPIRYYTYHKKGYHYFLADLCYFVNLLLVLSIWVFPNSKRLFISSYCLAMGNNAIAIAMWRNSLVFHSMDKVVR
jgi:tetrahydromethanopterin S-methyltransferase subunit B